MVSNRYLNVLASLFAFANVSVAQGLATQAPRIPSCTGFALSSNDTRIVALMSEPISTGVACDNSTNSITDPTCQVQSGAWLMLYNVAYLQNGSQYVGSTYQAGYGIWNATGDSEPLYGVGGRVFAVDNQTTTVSPGSSGYSKSFDQARGSGLTTTHADFSCESSCVPPALSLHYRSSHGMP